MKKNNIKEFIQLTIIILCILMILQFTLFIFITSDYGYAEKKNSQTNFVEFDSLSVKSRNNNNQSIEIRYIEDDFFDESKISFKKNIIVDTDVGKIKLLKIIKTFGGKDWEEGKAILQTIDNGYIIVGEKNPYGGSPVDDIITFYSDIWVIKIDNSGKMIWNHTFGGSKNDYVNSIQPTSDGGFIIAGSTESYGAGGHDYLLIKINSEGNMQWNKTFGGNNTDLSYFSHQTSDGGFIIIGTSTLYDKEGDIWLIKINSTGEMVWNKTFGNENTNRGFYVQQISDEEYIIAGDTWSDNDTDSDLWIIKIDDIGNMLWNITFGGNKHEYCNSVLQTIDNGFIILGNTISFGAGSADIWLIKINSSGELEWNKTFGGDKDDYGRSFQRTIDGGYIIGGSTKSYGEGKEDFWLIKIDSEGNEEWNKTYGGSNNERAESLQQTVDYGYIITGKIQTPNDDDIWLIKTDSLGNIDIFGNFVSINLIEGQNISSINKFNYTTFIPFDTKIKVQFSQDYLNWYNSNGVLNGWDILKNGSNSINLLSLAWNESNLFYRMNFSSDNSNIPSLENINISYTHHISIEKTDFDGDKIPDINDTDDDNDSYLDEWEEFLGTKTKDFNETPLDTDNDGEPDGDRNNSQSWMDIDDDNDGYIDKEELEANTDPTNPEDPPKEEPSIDDDENNKIGYTQYLILIITIIIFQVLIYFFVYLRKKK